MKRENTSISLHKAGEERARRVARDAQLLTRTDTYPDVSLTPHAHTHTHTHVVQPPITNLKLYSRFITIEVSERFLSLLT